MAKGVNKQILLGNLASDPELDYVGNDGTPVVKFRVATNSQYTNAEGEKVEDAQFHHVEAWEGLAEIIAEYLEKGDRVYIEGKTIHQSWQDDDGNWNNKTIVRTRDLVMLGDGGSVPSENGQPEQQREPAGATEGEDESFEPDDELPF